MWNEHIACWDGMLHFRAATWKHLLANLGGHYEVFHNIFLRKCAVVTNNVLDGIQWQILHVIGVK